MYEQLKQLLIDLGLSDLNSTLDALRIVAHMSRGTA